MLVFAVDISAFEMCGAAALLLFFLFLIDGFYAQSDADDDHDSSCHYQSIDGRCCSFNSLCATRNRATRIGVEFFCDKPF